MNYLNINKNKNSNLIYYLRNIYGIGYLSSKLICKILGYDVNVKTNELNQTDWDKIYSIIKVKYKFILDSEIKKTISDNIKKMKNIKCYKGMRHSFNLPVNGQRTHTNARTKGWR